MKGNIAEIEKLRMENEWLGVQMEILRSENAAYLRTAVSELEHKIKLMDTVNRQNKFLSSIVDINSGILGIEDFVINVYHSLYQN